ncbi:hypothetical protein SPRI_2547 [Streptomyces pristinaespiralis]|uniref:Secreted protein n=1 Tax=Streptomyces pristinaespiralis TaxID=38300 RepID=A0A0M3QI84_STRPR|nr:hypothetical protein SPRI_2547 [Streptomyces pristinaespiralis]
MPIIAAVITAAATIAAAVIAAGAVSSGDSHSAAPSSAGSAQISATASTSPAGSEPSAAPSGPPLHTLPSGVATRSTVPDTKPRVIASPDAAAEGAVVTLEAGGFAPGEQVRISFRDTSGHSEIDVRDVTAGSDGRFAVQVRVPVDGGKGHESPKFRVWSLDKVDIDNQADTPFTYIK